MNQTQEEFQHAMNDNDDSKYRWVSFIDRLSNGDITKHDEIYSRNYIETLNLLSWWKTRDEAERLAYKTKNLI
jgi:hypothetical protein